MSVEQKVKDYIVDLDRGMSDQPPGRVLDFAESYLTKRDLAVQSLSDSSSVDFTPLAPFITLVDQKLEEMPDEQLFNQGFFLINLRSKLTKYRAAAGVV